MYLILLMLGVIVTLAGGAIFTFGVTNNGFDLGNTLLIAGTTAFVGGLLLIALSEAVRQLRRIAESLTARPVGQMPRAENLFESASSGAPAAAPRVPFPPKPEPRRRAPMPAVAPEPRLDVAPSIDTTEDHFDRPLDRPPPAFARSSAREPHVVPDRDEAPLSPRAEPRFAAAREEKDELSEGLLATAFSRLDIALRSAPPAAETPKPNEQFESVWPPEGRDAPDTAPAEAPEPEAPTETPEEAAQPAEPYAVSILKSGVVDGMAYTLYSDGSIEAEMRQGTMRFASITELRAYLDKSSS
jgi:hypothetical protein